MDDGIEALIADHHRCDALFRQIQDTSHPDPSVVRRLIRELSVHDAIESECLNPLVEHRLADGNQLALETLGEHVTMAGILAEIDRRRADDPYRRELLVDLAAAARSHFANEEEHLLAPLRRCLAPEELTRLERELSRARRKAPTRPHPHAPRFAVGTHIAAAALRPIDRLRDGLRRRP